MNRPRNGRDLLFKVLRHEQASAVPWVPYAGIHAAKLTGSKVIEVLKDSDKMVKSLLAVNETYMPDGQPVIFDLQVEAEIYGCDLFWAENTPPSVASHPLAQTNEIPQTLVKKDAGRLPVILKAMREMKKMVGNHTALYGLVTGPLTLAAHLRGTELFMDMVRNPDSIHRLVEFSKKTAQQMAEFYIDAGMDIIAMVDPLISQVSPRHFKQFLADSYLETFSFLRDKKVFSSFFVCGNASKSIEAMCLTGPDSLAVDENVDMAAIKQITDRYNICLGGNIPITTTMLLGSPMDNKKVVTDLLHSVEHHNLIISPGCDLPFDTPIENVTACMQAVLDPLQTETDLKSYQKPYNFPAF